MRFEHSGLIFRMELCTDIPLQVWYFHYLHEVTLGIASYALHAVLLILGDVGAIKLIAVAMTLLNALLVVNLLSA